MRLPFKIIKWKSGQTFLSIPTLISKNLEKNEIWKGEFLDRDDTALLLISPRGKWELKQDGNKLIIYPKKQKE